MNIDLTPIPHLQVLFKLLSAGTHVNRLQDNELWVALEKHQYEYTALGFGLVLDGRGFAYFKTDQASASAYTGKLTRRLEFMQDSYLSCCCNGWANKNAVIG